MHNASMRLPHGFIRISSTGCTKPGCTAVQWFSQKMVDYGQVLLEAQGNAGYSVSILFLLFLGISLGWEILEALLTVAAESLGGGGAGTRLWLARLKEELLSLGAISLVLAFIKNPLTRICIPAAHMSSPESAHEQLEKFNKVAGRRLLGYMFEEAPMWQQSQQPVCDRTASDPSWLVQVLNSILFVNNMLPAARHQAQGGSSEVGCAYAGHALGGTHPLHHTGRSLLVGKHAPSGTEESSHEGTHTCPDNRTLLFSEHVIDAAHYLLFYLAIVQILYSLLSMGFSLRRFWQLRGWERAARAEPADIPGLLGKELLTRHACSGAKAPRAGRMRCAGGLFDCASRLWVGFWGSITLPTFDALRATLQLRSRAHVLHELRHVNCVNAAEQALQHELFKAHAHAWVTTLSLAILLLYPLHAYQLMWVAGVSPVLLLILALKMGSMLRQLPPMLDRFEQEHGLPVSRPLTAAAAAAGAAAGMNCSARQGIQAAARTAATRAVLPPVPAQTLQLPASGGHLPPTRGSAQLAPNPAALEQMGAGQKLQSSLQGPATSTETFSEGAGASWSLNTNTTSLRDHQGMLRIPSDQELEVWQHGEQLPHEPVSAAAVAAAAAAAADPDSSWQLKREQARHVESLGRDLDKLFWFGWPALMLWLIVIVSTINALSITVSVYFLLSTGPSTGIHAIFLWLVLLFIDILSAIYLGYVVQPQYALLTTALHYTPDKLYRILQAMNRDDDEEEGGITGLVLECAAYFHPHKRLAADLHRAKQERRRRHASLVDNKLAPPHAHESEAAGQHVSRAGGKAVCASQTTQPCSWGDEGDGSDATTVHVASTLEEHRGPGGCKYSEGGDKAVQSSGPSTMTATTVGTPSSDDSDEQQASPHALYPARVDDSAQAGAVAHWGTRGVPGLLPAFVAGPAQQKGAGGVQPGAGPRGGDSDTRTAGPPAPARAGHVQGTQTQTRASRIDDMFVALLAQRAGVTASRGPAAAGTSAAARAFQATLLHYAPVFSALARYWAAKARVAGAGEAAHEHLQIIADAEKVLLSATPEMEALRSAFRALDVDDSGAVSVSELAEHVRHVLGTRATEGELAAMLDEGGAGGGGGKGLIAFKGFLLTCAFAAFDVSGADRITAASLATSLPQMCAPELLPDVYDMISYADPDRDGQVGLRQFLHVFEGLHLKSQQPKPEEQAPARGEGQSQVAASLLRLFIGRKPDLKS